MDDRKQLVVSNALLDLVRIYINDQVPFTVIIDNNDNWDKTLPNRLGKRFILNMENTDLSDSNVSDDGSIQLIIGIDDVVYTKIIHTSDIHAVGDLGKTPLVVKSFIEHPPMPVVDYKHPTLPKVEDLVKSFECFKKYNPQLFKEP